MVSAAVRIWTRNGTRVLWTLLAFLTVGLFCCDEPTVNSNGELTVALPIAFLHVRNPLIRRRRRPAHATGSWEIFADMAISQLNSLCLRAQVPVD
jgi:hypothetical protein